MPSSASSSSISAGGGCGSGSSSASFCNSLAAFWASLRNWTLGVWSRRVMVVLEGGGNSDGETG
jgi:hypothetical protein